MIASVNGVSLAYDSLGSGPAVVFIGGGGALDRRMWEEQAPALEAAGFARTNGMAALAEAMVSNPAVLASAPAAVRERVKALYVDNADVFESDFAMVRHWQPTSPPAVERISSINTPTLLVVGDHDMADVRSTVEKLAGAINDAELVVIDNAGHLVNLDAPEAFAMAIARFVETVENG